jgi:hypothetical protein
MERKIMNVLKRARQTVAWAALIAVVGGCNQPETMSSPRPATVSITPANTNAIAAVAIPQPTIAVSEPIRIVAPATVAPASVPVEAPHSHFIASMEQELKTIGTNMDGLTQKLNSIEPNARIEADHDLAILRQKYQYTREQLDSLKGNNGDAWDNAKDSFVHVMQTLNDAYADVKAEFTRDGVM